MPRPEIHFHYDKPIQVSYYYITTAISSLMVLEAEGLGWVVFAWIPAAGGRYLEAKARVV